MLTDYWTPVIDDLTEFRIPSEIPDFLKTKGDRTKMRSLLADPSYPNNTGWQDRHNQAIKYPRPLTHESAIVALLKSWAEYAEAHRAVFDSQISDDYVLGPEWQAIGLGIRGLLNGETGSRLDCGTLDAFILGTLADHNIDTSTL